MNKEQFISELENLRVYDAHSHLVGSKLCAADFWEIIHYFWFLRELQGAGYPDNYNDLTEEKRVDAFLSAFNKTKSTGMHYAVRRIFKDLYGIEITDTRSVYSCLEKVKASFNNPGWAKETLDRGNIKAVIVNNEEHKNFIRLDGVSVWVPRIDGKLHGAARRIFEAEAGKRAEAAEKERTELLQYLGELHSKGANAIMTTLGSIGKKTWQNSTEKPEKLVHFSSFDDCIIYLLHVLCRFAEDQSLNIQFFLGVEHGFSTVAVPVDNNERIVNLYGLFEKYKINFDLNVASEGNILDIVQAAHIFRNVYTGGLWWFSFRPSVYLDTMAKRFEVLASTKSYSIISDARCVEWCYGKCALVKKLAGDFFIRKVEEGFVSFEDALDIAKDWFYTTAESLYGTGK